MLIAAMILWWLILPVFKPSETVLLVTGIVFILLSLFVLYGGGLTIGSVHIG